MLPNLFLILAYLIGSIPTSLLISKWNGVDLRSKGSGNLGATNVFRVMGWQYALPVFLIDGLKGTIPVWISFSISDNPTYHILVGLIAVLGHSLSVFVKFKGGKGAATGLGILLALDYRVFLIVFILAFSLIALFRYVAPVTLLCCVLTPILFFVFQNPIQYQIFVSIICLVIIVRHHSNIRRLLKGEEHKI